MVKNKICKYYRGPKGCKNGDNCKFRHQEQDPELSTAAFFSATSGRISPIKEEDPTPTSSINHDFNSNYDWPLLRSNGTIRPIKQEHPATTSKGKPPQNGLSTEELSFVPSKPPQDSSTAASPFANTDGSPQDDRINVSVPSSSSSADNSLSRKYVDALKENIDASATNETIPPIKQEYPQKGMNRSSLERGMFRTEHIRSYKEALGKKAKFEDAITFGKTQSKIGQKGTQNSSRTSSPFANTDGSPLDDGINVAVPSSCSSADKDSSSEDVGASANGGNGLTASPFVPLKPPQDSNASALSSANTCCSPMDAAINYSLYGPKKKRLAVFKGICSYL